MRVYGNDIYTIRGDTMSITLSIKNPNGTIRELKPQDKVVFSVKKDPNSEEYILGPITLSHSSDKKSATLEIDHSQTEGLELGEYFYDIKLQTTVGEETKVITVIPKSKFTIEQEITRGII